MSAAAPPLTPEETLAWMAKYRRDSVRYALGFWVGFVVLVFGLVSWELGEIAPESFGAAAAAGGVSAVLALAVRRRKLGSWTGTLTRKWVERRRRRSRDSNLHDEWVERFRAEVRTASGKRVRLRMTGSLFDYYREGDLLLKPSGFDWPLVLSDPSGRGRVCVCCGGVMEDDVRVCSRCRAPLPDVDTLRVLAENPRVSPPAPR